jgi:hypothetical protein
LIEGFHGFTSADPGAKEAASLAPMPISLERSAAPLALTIRMGWAAGWHNKRLFFCSSRQLGQKKDFLVPIVKAEKNHQYSHPFRSRR